MRDGSLWGIGAGTGDGRSRPGFGRRVPRPALGAALMAGVLFLASTARGAESGVPDADDTRRAGPYAMRGLGTVAAEGSLWNTPAGPAAHVRLHCESPAMADRVASKYWADLLGYSMARVADGKAALLDIDHAGRWRIGVAGNTAHVFSAPTAGWAAAAARYAPGADTWRAPSGDYPRWLDCFDNAAFGLWLMPAPKEPEVLDFARSVPGIINVHPHSTGTRSVFAPNVYDRAVGDYIVALARSMGKPYRYMTWGGLPQWWRQSMGYPRRHQEHGVPAAMGSRLHDENEYKHDQILSPAAQAMQLDVLTRAMERYRDDKDLIAWMEPHGEFHFNDPRRNPPNARERFAAYLRDKEGLSLEEACRELGVAAENWDAFPYPESSYFYGRRGTWLDLDDTPWRWKPGVDWGEGTAAGYASPDFDDAAWAEDLRTSRRILPFFDKDKKDSAVWFRFGHEVPAGLLAGGEKVYFHALPYTQGKNRGLSLWVNGVPATDCYYNAGDYRNKHNRFDVTALLKPGENHFAVFSNGGRIQYRVYLSRDPGGEFPFPDRRMNRLWLAWNDYLIWEKYETLRIFLSNMRRIDPDRPIKVMTPQMFQGPAFDLFERYGAYPQLTGEGAFFRPMHYKGYTRLRGLPSSSEFGGAPNTPRKADYYFACILLEGQDAHDYVFDVEREIWSKPDIVAWMKSKTQLLRTLGKTDFIDTPVAVLRDTEQDSRFGNRAIWQWDLSRGPLPGAGWQPLLVDGYDLDRGRADAVPVVIDCATTVMTPARVEAIRRYVRNGGTFVAQFNTGRHSPLVLDTWPLAKAFDLRVSDYRINGENLHKWPVADITFTQEQDLFASRRGQTLSGSGVAIDHMGNALTGALRIDADRPEVRPVALWRDGGMAIAEVRYGKGRLIWLGTPFVQRVKDVNGAWMNEADRQAMFEEFLAGLGVKPRTASSDRRVWVDKRASKNGLYDVYMASAFQMKKGEAETGATVTADLTLRETAGRAVVDMTRLEAVPARVEGDGAVTVARQTFAPYEVRQYALVRDKAGLAGPLHWLSGQAATWRTLEPPMDDDGHDRIQARVAEEVRLADQDGMPLDEGWKVRRFPEGVQAPEDGWERTVFNDEGWETAALGSWMARGWSDTVRAEYRRAVAVPETWRAPGRNILLGFKAGYPSLRVDGSATLFVNGKPLGEPLRNGLLVDVTEAAGDGRLALALSVTGKPHRGGPAGMVFLRSIPAPAETLDLSGAWRNALGWDREEGETVLPGPVKGTLGLRRTFEVPASWAGGKVALIIEQDKGVPVDAVIVNRTGYSADTPDTYAGYGLRVDQWIRPGTNELDLYPRGHRNVGDRQPKMKGNILSVRLVRYP